MKATSCGRARTKAWPKLAADELAKIDIIERQDVRDSVVVHMAKTYPAYFGAYDRFQEVRDYVDGSRTSI